MESKSAFETKTAAINVAPSPSSQHNIQRIKSDALWLSKEIQIDELEALRLTVLEWQYQPEARLKSGFSDAELASLRDGLGVDYVESMGLVPGSSLNRADATFDSIDALRVRLLQLAYSEQVRLLSTGSEIMQQSLLSSEPGADSTQSELWQPILKLLPPSPAKSLLDHIENTEDSIKGRLESLNGQQSWSIDEQYHTMLSEDFATSTLRAIAVILDLLLLQIKRAEEPIAADPLQTWLRFMESVDYFRAFQSDIQSQRAAIGRIQCSASFITVALLDPASTFASLSQDRTLESIPISGGRDWFIDKDNINDIHQLFYAAAESCNVQASLAIATWSLVLLEIRTLATAAKETREARVVQRGVDKSPQEHFNRRLSSSSTGSTQTTIYEDIISEIVNTDKVDDPVDYMLQRATQGANLFDQFARLCSHSKQSISIISSVQLQLLQEWIRAVRPSLGYSPELVSAQLTLLSRPPSSSSNHAPAFNPVANFVGDDALRQDFFDVAASRFPYESLPFLRMCRTLAVFETTDTDGTNYITFRLRELQSFTQAAVGGFASYKTYREDENANLVSLDYGVGMLDFQPNRLLTAGNSVQYLNLVPAQTIGEVIKETRPPVIRWQYSFPGLSLLGKWLEMYLEGTLREALSTFEAPEDVAAEIMGLLSVLLDTTYSTATVAKGEQTAQHLCNSILDDLSSGLDTDRNIINCIADLMEQQLQSPGRASMTSSGHEILISCIDFFSTYSKIQPQQAWPVLLRSSAFGAKGTRRSLPSLIASIEVPSQDFKLLESCSRLYEVVIDLSLVISFKEEDPNQLPADFKTSRRTPAQRINGAAILAYSETMYAAFESMTAWIFNNKQQKERITSKLASAFYKLLYYVFGIGESLETVTCLSASLLPAATFVAQMLQEADATSTGTGPLMSILLTAVLDQASGDSFSRSNLHCGPVLSLANLLVRYSHQPTEQANGAGLNLLNLVPIIVRLPFTDSHLWTKCHTLLSSLLSKSTSSLLGHLGSTSCVSFLDCLKHAGQITTNPSVESQMWDLLSRLVTVDQQWFAIVLITGSPPGREHKDGHPAKLQTRGKPILENALDLLTNIDQLDFRVSTGLLSFVAEAQQNWLSVTDSIASRTDLFPHLIKYVSSKDSYNTNGLDQALHNKVAAGVTDLTVIHLHRLMALKNEKIFVTFIPLLNWLTTNAVEVAAYNASLHANLKKNFAMKYRGLDVTSIKRTSLLDLPYGDSYFYDMSFADKILSGDPFWKNDKRNQSFYSEFQRANLNLSIVESEFTLLRSLARLCVERGKFFSRNRDVARIMAQVARHCLAANMQVTPPEALFDSLFQTRADLAVVVVRPLAAAGYRGSDYSALLTASWDATRFRNGSYEMAIANDDLIYWRSMLSVLLMSMQFRVDRKLKHVNVAGDRSIEQIDPYNGMFCEIAAKLIGEGLKSVVLVLQEQNQKQHRDQRAHNANNSVLSSTVGVKDVSLLLSLLQTTMRLPSLPQFAVQLSDALISTGTPRSALLLYSWSHILLESGQPVYADLATQFLASMSSLPKVAEELAIEGVLNRLLTARVTQTLQSIPSGVGHLDQRPNAALLYAVWCRGLLPLCLNLLHGVGGGVAGEVSGFLNMFPSQLSRASMAFAITPSPSTDGTGMGTGMITTFLANEISSLSLISFILTSYRDAGASAGVDPSMIAELTGWDEQRKTIAEDVRDFLGMEYVGRRRRVVVRDERERGLQGTLRRGTLELEEREREEEERRRWWVMHSMTESGRSWRGLWCVYLVRRGWVS